MGGGGRKLTIRPSKPNLEFGPWLGSGNIIIAKPKKLIIKVLPLPSQGPNAKFGLEGLIVSFRPPSPVRRPPPVLFKLRALKPDQGLSSLTRGFQGRPGASKPDMDGHFGHFQISDFGF